MSHTWISHVTQINESCQIYKPVISPIRISHFANMNHVTLTHESWPIHSYVPQDQLRALHIWDSHFAHMNEWYHTYEYVSTHSFICATGPAAGAAHMDESCYTQKSCHFGRCTCGWVMSHTKIMSLRALHIWMSHVTHKNHVTRTDHSLLFHVCLSCVSQDQLRVLHIWMSHDIHMNHVTHTNDSLFFHMCHRTSCGRCTSSPSRGSLNPKLRYVAKRPICVAKRSIYVAKETQICGEVMYVCGKRNVRGNMRLMCTYVSHRMWQYVAKWPIYVAKRPIYVAKEPQICGKETYKCGKWVYIMWQYVTNEYIWHACGNMWQMSTYVAHMIQRRGMWQKRPMCGKRDVFTCQRDLCILQTRCLYVAKVVRICGSPNPNYIQIRGLHGRKTNIYGKREVYSFLCRIYRSHRYTAVWQTP